MVMLIFSFKGFIFFRFLLGLYKFPIAYYNKNKQIILTSRIKYAKILSSNTKGIAFIAKKTGGFGEKMKKLGFLVKTIIALLVVMLSLAIVGCDSFCLHIYATEEFAPTCEEEGYTEYTCRFCGDVYNDNIVEALGHSYKKTTVESTCGVAGYIENKCETCGDSNRVTLPKPSHHFNGQTKCVNCSWSYPTNPIVGDEEWYTEGVTVLNITKKEHLAALADVVNGGNSLAGCVVYLEADIDLGYSLWTPIGTKETPFAGKFVGNGHVISNLNISSYSSNVGFFGYVTGEISDFTIDNASVYVGGANTNIGVVCGYSENTVTKVKADGYLDAKDSSIVGGLVGYAKSALTYSEGSIEVVGSDKTGGLVGYTEISAGVFEGLVNYGSVNGGSYTGGLFGYINTSVATSGFEDVENYGNVNGVDYVGGVFGYVYSSKSVIYIKEAKSSANVTGKIYIGGIAGRAESKVGSIIETSSSSGKISGDYYIGGIAGQAVNVAIYSCSNAGTELSASSAEISGSNYYVYLGGYVGHGYTVEKCHNASDITYIYRGGYVGGIAGYISGCVYDSTNSGNISGYDLVGGIAGYIASPNAENVLGLKNSGNISGKSYVGGLVGQWKCSKTMVIGESENSGAVNGDSYVGGVVGSLIGASSEILTVYKVAATGDVTAAQSYVGGLFGYVEGKASSIIRECTVNANISGLYVVGGIAGKAHQVEISTSKNDGSTVTATGYIIEGEETNVYLGGFVGCGYIVTDCTNNVDINYTSVGNDVGGIAGIIINRVTNCTNNGNIVSNASRVGGIAGRVYYGGTSEIVYSELVNNGSIQGKQRVGGIFGELFTYGGNHNSTTSIKANSLHNHGNIDGDIDIGGIFGYAYIYTPDNGRHPINNNYLNYCNSSTARLTATNFTNDGVVSGETTVGEILGYFYSDEVSTLDTYSVTGKIVISGAELEGNYDIGTGTTITLTNRTAPETEAPEGEPEGSVTE